MTPAFKVLRSRLRNLCAAALAAAFAVSASAGAEDGSAQISENVVLAMSESLYEPPLRLASAADSTSTIANRPPVDAQTLRLRNAAVIAGGLALVATYASFKWYDKGFAGGFKVSREGWFSEGTTYGGADKVGHVGFSYASTRLFSAALRGVGNSPEAAANLSLATVLATMTVIEVLDGYSRRFTFSREDAVMNVVGAALGWAFERYPAVDDLFDLRLRYNRSTKPTGERLDFDPFGDYEGQTYVVVAKASGVPALREIPVLRYVEVALGYGTRGFDPRTANPQRYIYYGVGINVGQLLADTVLKNAGPIARTANNTFFEYVQISGAQKLWKKGF